MRYTLIGVAVVASLALAGLGASYSLNEPDTITAATPAALALAMGWVAFGLIKRQGMGRVSHQCRGVPVCAVRRVAHPRSRPAAIEISRPPPGFDPAWLILLGALALALTVGAVAISVGGDLRRQRREREASK